MEAKESHELDDQVRAAVYRLAVETTRLPSAAQMARQVGVSHGAARDAYARLFARRLLVLESDGENLRMAPPFSGVETQHRVRVGPRQYFANCAWDALGVIAAIGEDGVVHSRCDQSLEPLTIPVRSAGPEPIPCIIHFAVPAAQWWDDIVYT